MGNSSDLWEGSIYFSTVSIFNKEGSLNKAFYEVGALSLWGFTIYGKDDKICSDYGNCSVPLYEYPFSTLGVRKPYTAFEVGFITTRWRPLLKCNHKVSCMLKPISISVNI